MKTLLVTPAASGETITAVHVAENLVAKGHAVGFLASPFARRMIPQRFQGQVVELTGDAEENFGIWKGAIGGLTPDAVVFADYPILVSAASSSPLGLQPGWAEHLDGLDVCLATLDHFGFGQCDAALSFGPPHLCSVDVAFPRLPDGMRVMLPCPMHHPGPAEARRGEPFRYWDLPLGLPGGMRREVRRRYLRNDDELLVLHSVPAWAWRMAEGMGLPFYRFLPDLLAYYFEDIGKPLTLVSVNNGSLLSQPSDGSFEIRNLAPLPITEFEKLLFGADLVITENKASIAMGKAICGLQPAAAMHNSFPLTELVDRMPPGLRDRVLAMEREKAGAVFPYEIFPVGFTGELEKLCLYRSNPLTLAFEQLEIFGGEQTREQLALLLADRQTREALQARQQAYVDLLLQTEDAAQVLERYLD